MFPSAKFHVTPIDFLLNEKSSCFFRFSSIRLLLGRKFDTDAKQVFRDKLDGRFCLKEYPLCQVVNGCLFLALGPLCCQQCYCYGMECLIVPWIAWTAGCLLPFKPLVTVLLPCQQ